MWSFKAFIRVCEAAVFVFLDSNMETKKAFSCMNKSTFTSRTGDVFIDTLCNRTGN